MIGFRMPTTAVIHSEYVFYFVRNLDLDIVADELAHSSLISDVKDIDKCLGRLHGVDIRDQRIFTNEDLGHCDTRVNCWSVREDGVCGYSFISSRNVESRKPGFEVFSYGESSRCNCPLSGIFKGFLDGFRNDLTKIWLHNRILSKVQESFCLVLM